ncbi:glucosamine-6-phosphate deaminase [Spiroplasma endosymbiont of Polydrusus pterygomalis]|uniref:glucosamine-6-phosphate deaminase n=1 Tax=Spiroplasma endosymbiont of Polydrusus pterygomalis TaxID=3139327 RepID=UPI003CCAA6FF
MKLIILKNKTEVAQLLSKIIIDIIKVKPNVVLGLATGSSPIETYDLLIADAKNNKRDWSKVTTFNLDEYVGLLPEHEKSYRYFMNHQLFNHIKSLKLENTYLPSGIGNLAQNIVDYEKLLKTKGPIDLQILGLGTNGHIAFNEPGTLASSKTHIVNLTKETIEANKRFFAKIEDVPTRAITMGIDTILQAKLIVLIATGINKAKAICELIEGKVSIKYPCTFLQNHDDVTVIIDEEAATLLKSKISKKN